jgi:hypothetical protein
VLVPEPLSILQNERNIEVTVSEFTQHNCARHIESVARLIFIGHLSLAITVHNENGFVTENLVAFILQFIIIN